MCVCVCEGVGLRGYTMRNSGNDPGLLGKGPVQISNVLSFSISSF